MESDIPPSSGITSVFASEHNKLHLSNIQFLAAVDCALALITLVFNFKQVILTIDGFPKDVRLSEKTDDNDHEDSHIRMIVAAAASLCLTLTQLLLACLMMISLSNREQGRTVQSNTRIIAGIWAIWSSILLIVLIVYAAGIQRFEDFWDKFYLFMLVSEIILRISIIFYTSLFFWCRFCNARQ